jgi:hypothetical protein
MMHWLHLCLGEDSMVQEPQARLLRILQALVFECIPELQARLLKIIQALIFLCFQGKIREEETLSWKRPKAQIQH